MHELYNHCQTDRIADARAGNAKQASGERFVVRNDPCTRPNYNVAVKPCYRVYLNLCL